MINMNIFCIFIIILLNLNLTNSLSFCMKKEISSKIDEEDELSNTFTNNNQLNPPRGGAADSNELFQHIPELNDNPRIRQTDENYLSELYENIYLNDRGISSFDENPSQQSLLRNVERIQNRVIEIDGAIHSINLDRNNLRQENLQAVLTQFQNITQEFNSLNKELKIKVLKIIDPEFVKNLLDSFEKIIEAGRADKRISENHFDRLVTMYNEVYEASRLTWLQVKSLDQTLNNWTWSDFLLYGSIFLLATVGSIFLIRNRNYLRTLIINRNRIISEIIVINTRLNNLSDTARINNELNNNINNNTFDNNINRNDTINTDNNNNIWNRWGRNFFYYLSGMFSMWGFTKIYRFF